MMEDGTPSVMMDGTHVMPQLHVSSWGIRVGNLSGRQSLDKELAELDWMMSGAQDKKIN